MFKRRRLSIHRLVAMGEGVAFTHTLQLIFRYVRSANTVTQSPRASRGISDLLPSPPALLAAAHQNVSNVIARISRAWLPQGCISWLVPENRQQSIRRQPVCNPTLRRVFSSGFCGAVGTIVAQIERQLRAVWRQGDRARAGVRWRRSGVTTPPLPPGTG